MLQDDAASLELRIRPHDVRKLRRLSRASHSVDCVATTEPSAIVACVVPGKSAVST